MLRKGFRGLTGIPLATTDVTGLGITPKSTGYDPGANRIRFANRRL